MSRSSATLRLMIEGRAILVFALIWAIRGIVKNSSGPLSLVGYLAVGGLCTFWLTRTLTRGMRARRGQRAPK